MFDTLGSIKNERQNVKNIFRGLAQQDWLVTKPQYQQIGAYNKLLKTMGTDEQKLDHYHDLCLAWKNTTINSPAYNTLQTLRIHLKKLCAPTLDNAHETLFPENPVPNNNNNTISPAA